MKRSKRYKEAIRLIQEDKTYSIEEAVELLKKFPSPKFDETVEVGVKLGVDVKKADQMVRGSVKLPHGTGKKKKILVFCEPEKEEEAREAGADFVGSAELIEKISSGWFDFDYCISTPSMMRSVSRLGKILGPRGLMPSPKVGTVTENIAYAVKEAKEGKLDFKMDKFGVLNAGVAKRSFTSEKIIENIKAFLAGVIRVKPSSAKGKFIRAVALSLTMSPAVKMALPRELDI